MSHYQQPCVYGSCFLQLKLIYNQVNFNLNSESTHVIDGARLQSPSIEKWSECIYKREGLENVQFSGNSTRI